MVYLWMIFVLVLVVAQGLVNLRTMKRVDRLEGLGDSNVMRDYAKKDVELAQELFRRGVSLPDKDVRFNSDHGQPRTVLGHTLYLRNNLPICFLDESEDEERVDFVYPSSEALDPLIPNCKACDETLRRWSS